MNHDYLPKAYRHSSQHVTQTHVVPEGAHWHEWAEQGSVDVVCALSPVMSWLKPGSSWVQLRSTTADYWRIR